MRESSRPRTSGLRALAFTGAALAVVFGATADVAAQGYSISQVPLVVPSVLDPNIILTLEDSANMQRAISPDSNFSAANATPANTRRFKSAAFNPLYYDPNVSYVIPPNANSTVVANYTQPSATTAFANAYVNGFYQNGNSWKINLTNGYRPTLTYDPTGAANSSGHVAADHAPVGSSDLTSGPNQVASSATANTAAYCFVYDPSNPTPLSISGVAQTCNNSPSNDACYRLVKVSSTSGPGGTDERLNFVIWYSFYRTRYLAMVSAAARVMNDPALSGTRVAWQGLNACNSFLTGNTCNGYDASGNNDNGSNLIDEFTDTRRSKLMSWLRRAGASGTVPLRTAMARAGNYYSTSSTAANNPYHKFPQLAYDAASNPDYACRPNYHILVAGSAWDDTSPGTYCSGAQCGDKDLGSPSIALPQAFPSGGSYPPATNPFDPSRFPYFDGSTANSNSLADVAFHYWITDLRTDLADKMLPYYPDRSGLQPAQDWNPKNDPARWQHMVNYVVGVGLKQTLGYTGPNATLPTNWGDTSAATGRLFDLWHAAVDSRGRFVGADTPTEIVNALTDSLRRAAPVGGSTNSFVGAALATNSTRLTTDSALYQAQFRVDDWTGRLIKIPVAPDGALQCTLGGSPACTDAADLIPAFGSRQILTWTGSAGTTFDQTGLTAAGAWASFGADDFARTAVVNYLRGQTSGEIRNGGAFRNRSAVLGDIVNSDIVFAGGENFGYQDLCPENFTGTDCLTYNTDNYTTYVGTKQSRAKMIYVGANDGMLHGFNADTMVEQFAYVPRSILMDTVSPTDPRAALVQLTDPSYKDTHRFFVDGSPWVGDACLKSPAVNCTGNDWRTLLVGTTGAGAKGVFALDVSNPASFSASNVLWDFTGQNDVDLGYVIGQPVIGRLNDNNYYAIFGNGYLSTRGCPVLYLVNLATGGVRRLSAQSGNLGSGNSSANCATANGLGRPSLFDDPNVSGSQPRTTDAIYVGDMLGQLWKFDVSSTNPGNWGVATGNGTPLFTARNKCGGIQPITGLIEIGAPPPSQNSGAMIYFGTGRFLSADDRSDTTRQTFYGIYDNRSTSRLNNPGTAATSDTTCSSPPTTDSSGDLSARKNLREQTLGAFASTTATDGTTSILARQLTSNTIDYTANGNNAKNLGWYIDLPVNGERMVTAPTLLAGRIVFSTLIPSSEVCDGGGQSTVVAADPFTGGKTSKNIFSIHNAVTYDSFELSVGIVKNLIAVDSGVNVWLFAGGSTGDVQSIKTIAQQQTGGSIRGRTAWREIFQ